MKTIETKLWKKLVRWLIYTAMALGFAGIMVTWEYRAEEKKTRAGYAPATPTEIGVTVIEVQKGVVNTWVAAEGIAHAVRKVHLQFEAAGRVVYIADDDAGNKLREGSFVSGPKSLGRDTTARGQILARIDSRDSRSRIQQSEAALDGAHNNLEVQKAALHQAKAQLSEAKQDLERKKRLVVNQHIPQSDYDRALARYRVAVASLHMAKDRIEEAENRILEIEEVRNRTVRGLEKHALHAPFNGVIARMNIRQGDYFDPADVTHTNKAMLLETAPITLLDPDLMEAILYLPDFMGRQVRTGQTAVVSQAMESWSPETNINTARTGKGVVYSVSPHIDAAKRAIRVKVRLEPKTRIVTDGTSVSCWISVARKSDVLRIPNAALLYSGSSPYVYLMKGDLVHRRPLTLGIRDHGHAEVIEGIVPGDRVVLKGKEKLYQGAAIRVISDYIAKNEVIHDR